jgi:hypothetical protein
MIIEHVTKLVIPDYPRISDEKYVRKPTINSKDTSWIALCDTVLTLFKI